VEGLEIDAEFSSTSTGSAKAVKKIEYIDTSLHTFIRGAKDKTMESDLRIGTGLWPAMLKQSAPYSFLNLCM
jgi:hypothetical protein